MGKAVKELKSILESLEGKESQLADMADDLGGIHYRLRQLPESEVNELRLDDVDYMRDMLSDAAGFMQELIADIRNDISELENNKNKSSGGSATAGISKPNITNTGEKNNGKDN